MAGTAPPHTEHALSPDAQAELADDGPVVSDRDRAALTRDGFVRLLRTGWTFHGAQPNATGRDRLAMTMIYLPDGTRLTEPTAGQAFDRRAWLPDAAVGEPIASWLNPLVWAANGAHAGTLDCLPPPAAMVGTFTLR
jgi:hypothetical protein